MIPVEKRKQQEFKILVTLDHLIDKTKQLMNMVVEIKDSDGKVLKTQDLFGKRDLWMRQEIGINMFHLHETITSANGIRVKDSVDYANRVSLQKQSLINLDKLRGSLNLSSFFITRLSNGRLESWLEACNILERQITAWMESDKKRFSNI